MTYDLDAATRLLPAGDDVFDLDGSGAYFNFDSAFGGWAVASCVDAVARSAEARGVLASVNAIFIDAIKAEPLKLRTTLLRRRSRTDFWRAEILSAEDDALRFSADLVMTTRSGDLDYEAAAPKAAAPEGLSSLPTTMGPKWLKRYDQRVAEGRIFQPNERPRTIFWVKEADGRPLDMKGLAAVADTFMPRTFFIDSKPRIGSTVSLSLHLFADPAAVEAAGDEFLLLEADAAGVKDGRYDHTGRIWRRDGRLLAATSQIAFF